MLFLSIIMIAFSLEIYNKSLKDHISNTKRVQRIVLIPPGHPIILPKSNNSIWPPVW